MLLDDLINVSIELALWLAEDGVQLVVVAGATQINPLMEDMVFLLFFDIGIAGKWPIGQFDFL